LIYGPIRELHKVDTDLVILLRLISLPYFRKHVLRTTLTAAGVALGVAVFVAMHAANESVLADFSRTIDRIAGKTDLQVTAGENGFPEETLEAIQSVPSVAVAVPIIEAIVQAGSQGSVLILGVDMTGDRSLREYDMEEGDAAVVSDPLIFLAQPDSLIVSRQFADRNALRLGSHLALGTSAGDRVFTIRGIMTASHVGEAFGGNIAVMDIYAAQRVFGRGRTFDRIDIANKPGVTLEASSRDLRARLGAGYEIQPPASRGNQAVSLLAGYTVMVNISSAFALFIGMFIVYTSFAVAVTQRRKEIGILRALGATSAQIRTLFLTESALLGAAGSFAGAIVGVGLAAVVEKAVAELVANVYGVAQGSSHTAIHPNMVAVAVVIGIATSILSAAIPALGAARINPVDALKKGTQLAISARESRLRLVLAAGLGALGACGLFAASSRIAFYSGYIAMLVAAVALAPVISVRLAWLLRPALRFLRPVEGVLAADSLIQSPGRTSATVSALMLSLALVVAFAGLARGSYDSIVDWLNTSLNADLFVMPSPRLDLRTTRFPPSMADEIRAVAGVSRVQRYRSGRIVFDGGPVMLVALEMESVAHTDRRQPLEGDMTTMYRQAAAGRGVLVSDGLAQRRGLGLHQLVEIRAPRGTITLPIVGVVLDYTDQQGAVFVDRSVFVKHWGDESVSDFRIFVTPGADAADVARRIREHFATSRTVFVMQNAEGRRYILGLINQWFGLMDVQIGIAMLVAVLGIFTTLTVSIIDRRRELAIVQAVGGLRSQVRATISLEAVSVAIIGLLLGLALGTVNLYWMLQVVRRDIAGFRLAYDFPVSTALTLVPLMLGAALGAAFWPAKLAMRGSLVEALEYE
jgi:putative ABC transport system permease protein